MIRVISRPRDLQTARVLAGYSQRGLCRKAGVNPATLNKAEKSARQVLPETAKAIATALDLEMNDLFDIRQEVSCE